MSQETIFKVSLYPHGAPSTCTCEVGITETGEIIEPDLDTCAYVIEAHKKPLEQAKSRLQDAYKRWKESRP